jgi:trehalose 6-phosphate synthase/phosphatase
MFAEKVAEVYRPGDLVLVHDYHLLLAPKMIREALGQVSHPPSGISVSVTPSAAPNGRRSLDSENNPMTPTRETDSKDKSVKDRVGGLLGHVGSALGHHLGLGDHKEAGEIMIGMFMHTPWPSSEIFRCLPSK